VRRNQLFTYEANKFSVGGGVVMDKKFDETVIGIERGDRIYMFSDGYADQFGGDKGKKFMMKQFREMLLEINTYHMAEQKKILRERFNDWKGELEQVDDILIIGIEI
jgi:serine phosphatase RsbU (regulator of sigma subunit)